MTGRGAVSPAGLRWAIETPHIAGLVTRMLAKHPGLNVVHVKGILRALADNIVDSDR